MTAMQNTVLRFCSKCGKDRDVDALSFRCLTCGMQTKYVAPAPNGASTAQTVALPPGTASRRWVEQTQALADAYAKAAHEAEKRAATATAEAERLRRASTAFLGLLKQVSVEQAAERPASHRGRPGLNGRWSRDYDVCIHCGTTERKHKANGFCTRCQSLKAVREATA